MEGSQRKSRKTIGVLMGGTSNEREVSLASGAQAAGALRERGYDVRKIDITTTDPDRILQQLKEAGVDIVFIALHGKFGEDGTLQEILEEARISYTGSGPRASRLAMDKVASKKAFIAHRIPTPPYLVCERQESFSGISLPVVIKPHCAGSSIGISIVRSPGELKGAFDAALSVGGTVLVEKYIPGRELTVGILNNRPLNVVEIIPKEGYYDYMAKYGDNTAQFLVPAPLEPSLYREVMQTAAEAHRALGCHCFSRVDIRLSETGLPFVLEVNSIPGLTAHSLFPLSAKERGISFERLIEQMVESGVAYEKEKTQELWGLKKN